MEAPLDFGDQHRPAAAVRMTDWAAMRRIAANPGPGFGAAYMIGSLQPVGCSFYDVLDVVLANINGGSTHPVLLWHQWLGRLTRRLRQSNDAAGARRNVARHDNLGYDFYRTFLDRMCSLPARSSPKATSRLMPHNKRRNA
jgi:cyclopropane-fatty-acyl-phospholipid synthase